MFNEQEIRALSQVVHEYAKNLGEDLMGALLHSGAFHLLPDDNGKSVVQLAEKIESLEVEKFLERRMAEIREEMR
jgi:hypothetical protein